MILLNVELEKNEFYIYLLNQELLDQEPQEVIEGKHYDTIKVRIVTIDLDTHPQVMDEQVKCKVTVAALEPLPAWYDASNKAQLCEDFEDIDICWLYNSVNWISKEELGIDYDFTLSTKQPIL